MDPDTEGLSKVISRYGGIDQDRMLTWKKEQREKTKKFLRTNRSNKIYKEIISLIQRFAATSWAGERLSLLSPAQNMEELAGTRALVEGSIETLRSIDQDRLKSITSLLRKIEIPEEPIPKYDGATGILAENDEIYNHLIENRLNRWCPVYTPLSLQPDSDLILYVYEIGNLDIDGDNVIMIPMDTPKESIIPSSTLNFYHHNSEILRAACEIQLLRGKDTCLGRVLELLEFEQSATPVNLQDIGSQSLEIANTHFSEAVKGVQLEGGAILEMLGSGTPEAIKTRLNEAERAGVGHFHNATGFHLILNTSVFPFSLDMEELEKTVVRQRSVIKKREFEEWARRAKELAGLKEQVIGEIRSLLEFDLQAAIAGFVRYYDLNFPDIVMDGDEIVLNQASHLKLIGGKDCVPIDYHLGGEDNVVILTGANSGGKTTLLETIAQTFILARMGFPVCCRKATLPFVEELFFHSRKAAMNAGAFESFLKSFIPVVKQGKRKLILADELEAITELDAGARIIATILSRVKKSDSFAVVVSHMSQEIGQRLRVRIDGIEAKGLDENLDLIVDRNPRIGYRARSTPELIVRRLHTLANGEERDIYGEILENFSGEGEHD